MKENLIKLCTLPGISGFEDAVRAYIREQAMPFADEIHEDPAGNLMILRRGNGHTKRVMLCAHMDETGFIVTHICPDGLLKFAPVGNFPARIAPGLSLQVGDAGTPGIIILKPIHLSSKEECSLTPPLDELRIDIGARSREEAEKLTFPGDFAAFASRPHAFGADSLAAKALDSRAPCAILLELIKKPHPCDVWYVFSVQRQIGSGIGPAVHRLAPDCALVLDGFAAGDTPDCAAETSWALGQGPVVPSFLEKFRPSPALIEIASAAAAASGIPVQNKLQCTQPDTGNAAQIAAGVQGVATLCLGLPVRYIRCAHSAVRFSDLKHLLTLTDSVLALQ